MYCSKSIKDAEEFYESGVPENFNISEEYIHRIIKKNGAILTFSTPFTYYGYKAGCSELI